MVSATLGRGAAAAAAAVVATAAAVGAGAEEEEEDGGSGGVGLQPFSSKDNKPSISANMYSSSEWSSSKAHSRDSRATPSRQAFSRSAGQMRSSSALLCAWKTRRRERNWACRWASRSMASLEKTPRLPTIAL